MGGLKERALPSLARRLDLKYIALAFIGSGLFILFFAGFSPSFLKQNSHEHYPAGQVQAPWPLEAAMRWDAIWYSSIVQEGYNIKENEQSNVAFWPLYPALVKSVVFFAGAEYIAAAGILISNGAFFIALVYLYRLGRLDHSREVAQRAVLFLAVFPTAFFFRGFYPEPVLLLCVTGAFYHWFRREWTRAGLFSFFAALSQPAGALLVAPFGLDLLKHPFHAPRLLAWAAPGLGGLLFMAILKLATDDPLAFVAASKAWTHRFQDPITTIFQVLTPFVTRTEAWSDKGTLLILAMLAIFLLALATSFAKQRPHYTVWTLSILALYLSLPPAFPPLASTSRYLLYLFPCFFSFALWAQSKSLHVIWTVISLSLLGVFSALFAQWYWVA